MMYSLSLVLLKRGHSARPAVAGSGSLRLDQCSPLIIRKFSHPAPCYRCGHVASLGSEMKMLVNGPMRIDID